MLQCVQPAVQSASSTDTDLFRVICDIDRAGRCGEAGQRQVHARSDDLGEDQEPAVQSGGRTRGFLQPPEGVA